MILASDLLSLMVKKVLAGIVQELSMSGYSVMHHGLMKYKTLVLGCFAEYRDENVLGVRAGLLKNTKSCFQAEGMALLQTFSWAETAAVSLQLIIAKSLRV